MARASNKPFSLHALPLAFAEQRDDVRHRMDAADQQFARDIDVGAVAQRARHDRLDHGEDVLDPVVELVDDRRQPPLEADPDLDFAAEPQIVVGDIAEQAADDAGQRQADRRHDDRGLLRALSRRWSWRNRRATSRGRRTSPSAPSTARVRPAFTARDVMTPWSLATQFVVGVARVLQHHREQRAVVIRQHQRRQLIGECDEAGRLRSAVLQTTGAASTMPTGPFWRSSGIGIGRHRLAAPPAPAPASAR